MKKVIMFVFSIIFAACALAALLTGVELVLTALGTPILGVSFWEQEAIAKFLVESETETAEGFLSGLVVLISIVCFVLHVICSKIGKSLVNDGEDVRANMGLSRIAHLLFVLSVPTLILDYVFRGVYDGGFILTCVMFGVPWLVFAVLTVPMSLSILFNDELYEGIPFSGGGSSYSTSSSRSYSPKPTRSGERRNAYGETAKQETDRKWTAQKNKTWPY